VPTEILKDEKGPSLPSTVEYCQFAIHEAVLEHEDFTYKSGWVLLQSGQGW